MTAHNPNNERTKRRYFTYLKEARRYSEPTVDAVAAAIHRFEVYSKFRDFRSFHHRQAIAFKNYLAEQRAQRSGDTLSKATLHCTLNSLKKFFFWLAGQPGYKSQFTYADTEYFNISAGDVRVATARREQAGPTLDQVEHVIATMPADSAIERRNRALIAFTLLTGARDSAIASMRLRHVDLVAGCVEQDAREVQTKFSKTFTTFFFPVGDEIRRIVAEWVAFLQKEMLWGNDDPLFPKTRIALGPSRQFEAVGLERSHWKSAARIRTIFRDAFTCAELPYFNPHSFRNTIVRLGQSVCKTPEEFKAWSQNLGHDRVLTTFLSYGQIENLRQGEIIRGLATPQVAMQSDVSELAKALVREMRGSGAQLSQTRGGPSAGILK